jgi:photosystem II stability/assembly factor-like uncharacterized protein
MKKNLLIIASLAFASIGGAQSWKNNLPQKSDLKLQDYQEAFNSYFEDHPEELGQKGNGYKQYKRWEWFWKPRVNPDGSFPANNLTYENWKAHLAEYPNAGSRGTLSKTWSNLGPSKIDKPNKGEGVGRLNCIAFHPTNANTFWVGSPSGGLWKTTDNGATWTTNTDNLPVMGVSDIVIHPTGPDTMWIATGDGDMAHSLSSFGAEGGGDTKSLGIFKSVNGGATWTQVYSAKASDGLTIRRLIIDKQFPSYLYAATSIGILATADGGANWSNVQSGHFIDIEFHPTSADTLYASTFDEQGGAAIYISGNGGANFTMVYSNDTVNRYNLEVTPAESDYLYALGSEAGTDAFFELVGSPDRGASWITVAHQSTDGNLLGWEIARADSEGQGSFDLAFAVSPTDDEEYYVGGVSTWKTDDGAASWTVGNYWGDEDENGQSHSHPVVHADKHFMTFHSLRPGELYECNDGGLFRTSNGGQSWENLSNGLEISQIYDMAHSDKDPQNIVMGLQDNGSKQLKSGTWKDISGGDGVSCAIDSKNGYTYSTYVEGVLYRTSSLGVLDEVSSTVPISGKPIAAWITPFELDPLNPSTIYLAYDEIWKSTNSGTTWTQVSNLNFGTPIEYYSVSSVSSQVQLIGTVSDVMVSTDGGATFTDISTGLPLTSVKASSVYCGTRSSDVVFVTLSGFSASHKIYYSSNKGSSWSNITGTGLPNVPCNAVVEDANSGDLYVGTDLGVYFKTATATSWSRYGDKMPNVVVTDLEIHYGASKVRAATFGRGLWESDLNTPSASSLREKSVAVSSIKVYPNPGNGQVTLELNGLDAEWIGVYDYSGALLKTVDVNGNSVEADLSEFPAGIYFLGTSGQYFQDFTRYIKQ